MRDIIITLAVLFIAGGLLTPRKSWALPAGAQPYAPDILAAETNNGLPPKLLARVLYQESRYRPDIISGETKSSAGAVGIAQIVPRWHPGVNPLNPTESIYYAADYLRQLHDRFGSWPLALAAYNWGQGNVNNALKAKGTDWFSALPTETRNYVNQITADVAVNT